MILAIKKQNKHHCKVYIFRDLASGKIPKIMVSFSRKNKPLEPIIEVNDGIIDVNPPKIFF